MNGDPREHTGDTFDRIYGTLHGLPDHDFSRPSTVTSALPIIGRAQTYVVQTVRTPSGQYVGFVQSIDAEGSVRLAIPEKVMDALYRQRDQLLKRAKSRTGREKWERRQAQLREVQ